MKNPEGQMFYACGSGRARTTHLSVMKPRHAHALLKFISVRGRCYTVNGGRFQ